MELRVLGGIELSVGGRARPLGPAQRLLLALLLVERHHVVSADALSDALWASSPPPTARATLQTHLSKLRHAMLDTGAAILVNRPPGYVLEPPPASVDADRFDAAVSRAATLLADNPRQAAAALDAALSLWSGPAFAEFAEAAWARAEAVRLEELRLGAFEARNDALLAMGEGRLIIGELEGLVGEHPLRERFWAQLMTALHHSGRQGEALRAGQALRHHLRDELGLDPSPALRALEEAIATDDLAAPSSRQPASAAAGAVVAISSGPAGGPPSMPGLSTELIGRGDDLEHLVGLIASARLLTLTGPGGVGKSTLAAALVRRVVDRFRDGVRFVELATVQDAAAVLSAVAQALDVERRAERSLAESIAGVLGARQLLLVLDNCEHVLAGIGPLVDRIVHWCPQVQIVATSREPIGIAGEVVGPVAPLGVPTTIGDPLDVLLQAPAMKVFVARAQEAAPAFEITARSAPAVAQICIQLDGLPLALELAAARMASMSPQQLAARLHERFSLLGGAAGRVARHRTLVDLVQWSYELLPEKERILFARLSVFAGGFDLDVAEQVCGVDGLARVEIAHLLSMLVDKSLVVANHTDDRVRFVQLETLRQFGADRLDRQTDAVATRCAHLQTFVELAELGAVGLDGPDEAAWGDRLEGDLGNLRVALRFAVNTGDVDRALRLAAATREMAFRRIRYEIVDWAEAASHLDGAPEHPLFPTVLAVVGYGNFVRGELDRAVRVAEQAVAARERLGIAACGLPERVLGNALFYRGDLASAVHWIERLVVVAQTSGGDGRLAHALYMCSVAHTSVSDPEAGRLVAEEAGAVAARCASPTALAQAAYASGLATVSIDVDAAIDLLDRSAALAGSVANRWMRAFALTEAMWLRAGRGETTAALGGYRQVVETWFQGGDWANQWLSLRQLAGILAGIGCDEEAALLLGSVDAAGASFALPLSPADADALHAVTDALRERLGPTTMAEITRRSAMMRDEATVAAALQTIAELLGSDRSPGT